LKTITHTTQPIKPTHCIADIPVSEREFLKTQMAEGSSMSKYITGQEIINEFQLQLFEFYNDYVRSGLIPLNHLLQPFSPYDVMAQQFNIPHHKEALFQLNDSIHDLDWESAGSLRANRIIPLEQTIEHLEARLAGYDGVVWADFDLSQFHKSEAQYVLDTLQGSLFNRIDALEMVKEKVGPKESEDALSNVESGNHSPAAEKDIKNNQKKPKSSHPTHKDKRRVQLTALELLDVKEYEGYYSPQLADTEEMFAVSKKSNGKFYRREKIIEWINEVLPDDRKLKGAPPKIK
jgi:hypothetical protein